MNSPITPVLNEAAVYRLICVRVALYPSVKLTDNREGSVVVFGVCEGI